MLQPYPWRDGITGLGLSSCAHISDWKFALFTAGMTESLEGGSRSPFTCFVVNRNHLTFCKTGTFSIELVNSTSVLFNLSKCLRWSLLLRFCKSNNVIWHLQNRELSVEYSCVQVTPQLIARLSMSVLVIHESHEVSPVHSKTLMTFHVWELKWPNILFIMQASLPNNLRCKIPCF